jgi:hypothetical protein
VHCHLKTGFYTLTRLQSTLLPQSRNSNGSEGVKMIQHQSSSQGLASANFSLPKGEVWAGSWLSQNRFKMILEQSVFQTITKDKFSDAI